MFLKGIGAPELIIILVVILVIFGPKQLPKLGKMFGKTMKEVRKGMDEMENPTEDEPASKDAVSLEDKKSEDTK